MYLHLPIPILDGYSTIRWPSANNGYSNSYSLVKIHLKTQTDTEAFASKATKVEKGSTHFPVSAKSHLKTPNFSPSSSPSPLPSMPIDGPSNGPNGWRIAVTDKEIVYLNVLIRITTWISKEARKSANNQRRISIGSFPLTHPTSAAFALFRPSQHLFSRRFRFLPPRYASHDCVLLGTFRSPSPTVICGYLECNCPTCRSRFLPDSGKRQYANLPSVYLASRD